MNDTPEFEQPLNVEKPTPPAPPAPGEIPPAPAPAPAPVRAPVPEVDPLVELAPAPAKSPPLAAFLSVMIPGLGYLYTWSYERAFMVWATIALSVFMIVDGMWPFSFLIAFAYFFAIFDSYREAQFYNLQEEEELPKPRPTGQGRLMFGVFLAVVAAVILVDKFDLFDIYWIYDWWAVPVFLVGIYFIIAAIRDRSSQRRKSQTYED